MPPDLLPPLPYEGVPLTPPPKRKTPNRTTTALKEAILIAASEVGDELAEAAAAKGETLTGGLIGYLKGVARTDVKAFAGLLGKVLPMQVTGADGNALEVTFRTVYETKAAAD